MKMNDNVSKYTKTFMKWIALVVSWLTLSPVFYYLAKRWNFYGKKTRLVAMLVSPMFLMIYLCVFLSAVFWQANYSRENYFLDRDRIERITDVRLPKFKVKDYTKGNNSFNGDYNDGFYIEFNSPLPDSLFERIDSLIVSGNQYWEKSGYKYTYYRVWGNGIPAPNGESDNDDRFFGLTIVRFSETGYIGHGMW